MFPLEPDFSYLEALAPYQPLAMKCIYCPIDTRLNFIQVSKLLKEVQVRGAGAAGGPAVPLAPASWCLCALCSAVRGLDVLTPAPRASRVLGRYPPDSKLVGFVP